MDTKYQKASEEIQPTLEDVPVLCVKGCGFYGRKSTGSMCSSCFKKSNVDDKKPIYIADSPALSASAPQIMTKEEDSTIINNTDTTSSAPSDMLMLLPPPQLPVQEIAAAIPPTLPTVPIAPVDKKEELEVCQPIDSVAVEIAERPVQKNKQRY